MQLADGQSLAEKTWIRAASIAGRAPVLTVTSRDYYFFTRDLYGKEKEESRQAMFLLEPLGRNTAPAIGLAALYVRENLGDDASLLIMPADHLVKDQRNFEAAVHEARQLSEQGLLVTFGIHPTHAETGYGYIRHGEPLTVSGAYRVDAFVEKPNLETAKEYLRSGEYHWNSGMFCFQAGAILEALGQHAPQVYDSIKHIWESMNTSQSPLEIPAELFRECPSISIDYAVMERAENCAVVASEFGWSDVGSWKAISELYESDEAGNRVKGKAVMVHSRDCFVQSDRRLVAAVGVKDLVIVDTRPRRRGGDLPHDGTSAMGQLYHPGRSG
jgi:mannose-1-phosphate guanylyltransferase/mannose-6-phosphate isomerase